MQYLWSNNNESDGYYQLNVINLSLTDAFKMKKQYDIHNMNYIFGNKSHILNDTSFIPYSIEDVIFIFSLYYHNKWHNLSSNNFLEHLFTCQMINNKIGDIVFVQSFTLKIEMNGMEFKTENKENCSKIINVCLFEEWVFVITISDSIVATTINQRRYSIWLLIFTYVQQYVFINVEIYFWIPKWNLSLVMSYVFS